MFQNILCLLNFSINITGLTSRFAKTDKALDMLKGWPKFKLADDRLFNSRLRFQIRLADHR